MHGEIMAGLWLALAMSAWSVRFGFGIGAAMPWRHWIGWFVYGLALPLPALVHAMARRLTLDERRAALAYLGCDCCEEPLCDGLEDCARGGQDCVTVLAVCGERS